MHSTNYQTIRFQELKEVFLNRGKHREVFEQPSLTAFRRQNNLRNRLVKLKVPPPQPLHPKRELKGMSNCGKPCTACPFVKTGKT